MQSVQSAQHSQCSGRFEAGRPIGRSIDRTSQLLQSIINDRSLSSIDRKQKGGTYTFSVDRSSIRARPTETTDRDRPTDRPTEAIAAIPIRPTAPKSKSKKNAGQFEQKQITFLHTHSSRHLSTSLSLSFFFPFSFLLSFLSLFTTREFE